MEPCVDINSLDKKMRKKYNLTINMANPNLAPSQRGTIEVIKTPSRRVPFHYRGANEPCPGRELNGTLKPSTAVPDRTVIECLTCHTNLIPTFSTQYS